jgi:hypothetical protein
MSSSPDLVKRFQLPIFELLVDFGDELLDAVAAAKGVDVDSVRADLLDPLRAYLRDERAAPPGDAGPPRAPDADGGENVSPLVLAIPMTLA